MYIYTHNTKHRVMRGPSEPPVQDVEPVVGHVIALPGVFNEAAG